MNHNKIDYKVITMKIRLLILSITFSCITSIAFTQEIEEVSERKVEVEIDMAIPPPIPPPEVAQEGLVKKTPKHAIHGQQNGRYGYYTSQKWLIPPDYDELDKGFAEVMKAKKNNKYGLIDRLNNEVLPFEYDKLIKTFKAYKNWKDREWTGLYTAEKNGKKGIIDKNGVIKIPLEYATVHRLKENLYSVGSEELGYGLVDLNHKIILPFDYEAYVGFKNKEKMIFGTKKDGKFGWIDIKGKVILPFEYEELKRVGYPKALYYDYKKNGKWGFMSLDGEAYTPPKYDWIKKKIGSVIIVSANKKLGVVGTDFKEIIAPTYRKVERLSSLYMKVSVGDLGESKYGLIDTLGNIILDTMYQKYITAGARNLIFAQEVRNGRKFNPYAIYNQKGEQIVPPTYSYAKRVGSYYAVTISLDNDRTERKALMNDQTKVLTPYIYSRFESRKKRGSKDEYIIFAERGGWKGTLQADGTENDDFKLMNHAKQNTAYAQKEKKKEQLIFDQIQGEWYGINHNGYLVKEHFINSNVGTRTVYFLEDGKECSVEYPYVPKLISSLNTIITQVLSQDMTIKCDQPSAEFLKIKDQLLFNANLDYSKSLIGNKFSLKGYTRKTSPSTSIDDYEFLRKVKLFKQIEKELAEKVEPKPGGLRFPSFEISPIANEVWVNNYSKYLFGKMVLINGEYIFEPRKWASPTMTYSLSGILRNIRYKAADGKVKTGDLDIAFLATKSQPFYFKVL